MSDTAIFYLRVAGALLVSSVGAFAATPLVKRLAQRIGAIDVPLDDRRMHTTPIPRLGGLAIFAGFLVALLIFAPLTAPLYGILVGAVIIVALGVVDDVVRLPWWLKGIGQALAAGVAVWQGVRIEYLSNPFPFIGPDYFALGAFAIPVTVIWIMALTNAVNFIDGLDGLAVGVSAIGSVSLLIIALFLGEPDIALVMAALFGGCLGFLPFNINPAKLFMGDTGATFLGFVLATVSIQGLFKMYTIISFAIPFLILGLPILDIVVSIFRRILHGQNPAHGDRAHIHHRLIDMGLTQKQAVAILYTISAILGLIAVVLTTDGMLRTVVLGLSLLAAIVIGLRVIFPKHKNGVVTAPAPAEKTEEVPREND